MLQEMYDLLVTKLPQTRITLFAADVNVDCHGFDYMTVAIADNGQYEAHFHEFLGGIKVDYPSPTWIARGSLEHVAQAVENRWLNAAPNIVREANWQASIARREILLQSMYDLLTEKLPKTRITLDFAQVRVDWHHLDFVEVAIADEGGYEALYYAHVRGGYKQPDYHQETLMVRGNLETVAQEVLSRYQNDEAEVLRLLELEKRMEARNGDVEPRTHKARLVSASKAFDLDLLAEVQERIEREGLEDEEDIARLEAEIERERQLEFDSEFAEEEEYEEVGPPDFADPLPPDEEADPTEDIWMMAGRVDGVMPSWEVPEDFSY